MTTKLVTVVGSVALVANVALAGPLPDPPFTAPGGFNPPTATVLKQELAVGKIISKYVSSVSKCNQKALASLQKAAAAALPTTDAEVAFAACVTSANTKYVAARDKQLLTVMPLCLNQAGIDAIKGALDLQLPLLSQLVYCDVTLGANGPTGLNIPGTVDQVKSELAISKIALKAGTGVSKCYTKAVGTVFKNLGVLPAADLTKFNDCAAKVQASGTAAVAKVVAGGTLPGCLTPVIAQALVDSAIALGGGFNDETYCASPSGAFID